MRILLQQKMKVPPVQSTLLFADVFLNSTTFDFPLASRLSGQLLLNSPIKCYYMVIVKLMQTSWTERNLVLLNIKHFSLSMDVIIDSSRAGSTDTCHSTFCNQCRWQREGEARQRRSRRCPCQQPLRRTTRGPSTSSQSLWAPGRYAHVLDGLQVQPSETKFPYIVTLCSLRLLLVLFFLQLCGCFVCLVWK